MRGHIPGQQCVRVAAEVFHVLRQHAQQLVHFMGRARLDNVLLVRRHEHESTAAALGERFSRRALESLYNQSAQCI